MKFAPFFKRFFLLLIFSTTCAFPQYAHVDSRIKAYPKTFYSFEPLGEKIASEFKSDEDRARAVFSWIALNVRYDLREYNSPNTIAYTYKSAEDKIAKELEFRTSLANKTIKSGKGVCEGYASLFILLCKQLNLEAVIIPGTSRNHYSQIGKLPTAQDHAWNAVRIDGQWKLVDVTWAAGVVDSNTNKFVQTFNDAYFFSHPDKFFLNHYPDDERWLLTKKTPQEFAAQAFYYPTFLNSDYKLSINSGTISLAANKPIVLNIENLKADDRVYYISGSSNVLEKLQVGPDNSVRIYPGPKVSGYITMFINEKPMVSYKISRI